MRALYIEGWDTLDPEKLVAAVSDDFVFDDPAEAAPATKATLVDYMHRWIARTEALGSTGVFEITDRVVQDKDGIRLEWEWWKLNGTDLQGAAIVKTSDDGVMFERITYYER